MMLKMTRRRKMLTQEAEDYSLERAFEGLTSFCGAIDYPHLPPLLPRHRLVTAAPNSGLYRPKRHLEARAISSHVEAGLPPCFVERSTAPHPRQNWFSQ
ncbi:uncharacterized protein [Dermacentor albipictus]|uniref:uncharacterized protein isoform X2 n=1 Tax=Dermacentor albipictus TaxID=60249 RepID=UPI0038FBF898